MSNKYLDLITHKGDNIHCEDGFFIFNGHHNIIIGSNVFLVDTLINAGDEYGKVIIDDYVFFGHGVKVLARGHNYKTKNRDRQVEIIEKPIHIKEGAWIGSGSIILGGVTIGKHAVVGAGSIVTKNVEDEAIVAGNPVKLIKYIDRNLTFMEKINRLFT